MSHSKKALSIIFIAAAIFYSMLHAEPASRDRPERFLLLLKPGDRISFGRTGTGTHSLTVYSEDRYQERIKAQISSAAELRLLDEKFKGQKQSFSPNDLRSDDPEVQQRVKDLNRLQWLKATVPTNTRFGHVTHIGTDYIAVLPENQEQPGEQFIPAWAIVAIRHVGDSAK